MTNAQHILNEYRDTHALFKWVRYFRSRETLTPRQR